MWCKSCVKTVNKATVEMVKQTVENKKSTKDRLKVIIKLKEPYIDRIIGTISGLRAISLWASRSMFE